ncbi:MAG: universal stress protein [Bacteroidales bacterium]|nr:universal stress protein [Bacteroidales bacterium]MDY0216162.1 universal stress protein [Bacteroidales bacterium]
MKGIIVGTDFSESSINALLHATTIADKAKCDITLIWAKTPGTTLGLMSENINEYADLAEKQLIKIADDHKTFMPKGNKIIPKIVEGRVHQVLAREALEMQADLVVVGAHGISGEDEVFIGNNAYRTVISVNCPVLTIRNQTKVSRALTDIIVPIDYSIESRQKVPIAVKFAKLFSAKIHVLGLYTSDLRDVRQLVDAYMHTVDKYLKSNNIRYQMYKRESFNTTETTVNFADEIDANLIVIMTEQTTDFTGIWLGSQARDMINNSRYPVLSVTSSDFFSPYAK